MNIGLGLENRARFEYGISKNFFLSFQMSRFLCIRKVWIWCGFTCQQVPPPPRYLSRRSGCRAVAPEAQKGGCATSAEQVAGGTTKRQKTETVRRCDPRVLRQSH